MKFLFPVLNNKKKKIEKTIQTTTMIINKFFSANPRRKKEGKKYETEKLVQKNMDPFSHGNIFHSYLMTV